VTYWNTTLLCNKSTRSNQPCIPPGLLNRVPALSDWHKGSARLLPAVWYHMAYEFRWQWGTSGNYHTPFTLLYFSSLAIDTYQLCLMQMITTCCSIKLRQILASPATQCNGCTVPCRISTLSSEQSEAKHCSPSGSIVGLLLLRLTLSSSYTVLCQTSCCTLY